MATQTLSIKPYAIPAQAAGTWLGVLRRASLRTGARLQRWRRRLSAAAPWYDESEHGNRLVMWS